MNHPKKLMLFLSSLLLVSLACTTLLGDNSAPQPAANENANNDHSDQGQDNAANDDADQPASNDAQNTGDDSGGQPAGKTYENGIITAVGNASEVEVIEMNWAEDDYGYVSFYGIIQNNGRTDLNFVVLDFTLRDAAGTAVANQSCLASLSVVPSGSKSPFEIGFSVDSGWDNFEIIIDGSVDDFDNYYTGFDVVSSTLQMGENTWEIVGEIKNIGDQTSDVIGVFAVAYNSDDEIITVDFAFTDVDVLAPGETSTFKILIWETLTIGGAAPDDFMLYIEGNIVSD